MSHSCHTNSPPVTTTNNDYQQENPGLGKGSISIIQCVTSVT